jgi:hypothetical protein
MDILDRIEKVHEHIDEVRAELHQELTKLREEVAELRRGPLTEGPRVTGPRKSTITSSASKVVAGNDLDAGQV